MTPDDLRGDILLQNIFEAQRDCIIDVRVTDTDQPSQLKQSPEKEIKIQEKDKKTKYLKLCLDQRRSFLPFVVSTDGLLGKEARSLLKQISILLVGKWDKPYSVVAGIVHSRMSIAIVQASHHCIRGSRISYQSISREIEWEGGSGTGLYRIQQ